MWLQRRRFGMVRPLRLVAVAMICVYTMTLAGLTVAPAYDVAVTCRNRVGGVLRADPFHTVAETLGLYRGGAGWLELATSFPVLQVAMHMALFLPLGLILRGGGRLVTASSLPMAVLLSALIELPRYTRAWGLYPCEVRIAEIEDLIANSLGGWIGALVAPVLSRLGVPLFTREERPAGHLGGSGPWNDAASLPPSAAEVGHDGPMGQVGEPGADEQERGAGAADR